jgi:hypothetical protein
MSKTVEIEFKEIVFVAPGAKIPKGMKMKVQTQNEFPLQWEVKEQLRKNGFWKDDYNCGLDDTYFVVNKIKKPNINTSKTTKVPFVRLVLYYSIGLILPFVFAKPIIKFIQFWFSFDGILWKTGEKNNATPIDHIPRFKRAVYGIILPWWALKMIFDKN